MTKPNKILDYCLANLKDTVLVNSWGEYGIFYNPGRKLKRGSGRLGERQTRVNGKEILIPYRYHNCRQY